MKKVGRGECPERKGVREKMERKRWEGKEE